MTADAGLVSGPPAALGSCRFDRPDLERIEHRHRVRPAIERVGWCGECGGGRATARASARARTSQDRGHQFSVRSVHVCVRARTATTVRGEAAASYVPTGPVGCLDRRSEGDGQDRPISHNAVPLPPLTLRPLRRAGRPLTANARAASSRTKRSSRSHELRPALRAVVAAAVIAALAPSTAFASTWTVDDDKADCPNAASRRSRRRSIRRRPGTRS